MTKLRNFARESHMIFHGEALNDLFLKRGRRPIA